MTEFLISIFYFILFCLLISKLRFFRDSSIPNYWFIIIFGIKIIFSIILTAIYTNYYSDRATADIFKYFDDSKIMFDALKTHPGDYVKMLLGINNDSDYFNSNYYNHMIHWYRVYGSNLFSDSHMIIRFNALVRLFSFGYFQVHNVFINFISLIGLTAVFKAFKPIINTNEKALLYMVFLIPSVLFWGSGLLKEGIVFFALGLLIYHCFKILHTFSIQSCLIIIFSLVLIFYTKLYIIAAFTPAFMGYIIYKKVFKKKILLSYFLSISIIAVISFILNFNSSKWDPFKLLIDKQADFITLINRTDVKVNSDIYIPVLKNIPDIFVNIPNAWLNTFIRPFLWECSSPFAIVNSIENLIIIGMIIISIIYRKQKIMNIYLLFCLTFAMSLFTIIGLTTPVFGAIARYKVPGLPFLLITLLFIIDLDKIKHKYPLLNKIL